MFRRLGKESWDVPDRERGRKRTSRQGTRFCHIVVRSGGLINFAVNSTQRCEIRLGSACSQGLIIHR